MTDLLMRRSAIISDDGVYRYELRRIWNDALPLLVVCMLNPSKADADVDDPTILALIHFATLWGYGGLLIVNLYAFRSPHPDVMAAAVQPCGPRNDGVLDDAAHYASGHGGKILVAWGNGSAALATSMASREQWFLEICARWGVSPLCLGITQRGAPKHPMARGVHRISRDQQPIEWKAVA